ncbi:MAG: outer membrane lipoprotein carrier protein LolA [Saprospiraceae bacterium]
MQKLLLPILLLLTTHVAFAQNFTSQDDSDPQARKVLEKMRQKYETYPVMKVDFTLTIEIPEQPVESPKCVLVQQGEKYRLNVNDRTIVSDGKSVWLYIPEIKEVQINDVDEDVEEGTIISPKGLLRVYEWKNFVYVLNNEFAENGRVIQQIEFKPMSRDSDFSKIRLTLDKKTLDVVRIKSFSKDGSRFTLTVDKLSSGGTVAPSTFTFSKSECPDCRFVDLRID